MRIVIDATAAVSGGKVYLDQLLPQFAHLGNEHEFVIFHMGDFDDFASALPGGRFQFRRVALPRSQSRLWLGSSVLKLLWRLLVLPLHLRRLKPDLLFSNAGFGPGWRSARIKTVLALHNSMPLRDELIADERSVSRRWRLVLLRKLMHRALRNADASVVFSEDTKQRVLACFPDLRHQPSVVHHGIDWGEHERRQAARTEGQKDELPRLGLTPPYLLYVSQFHRYKNVLLLLEALAQLSAKHPQLSLALVGEAADQSYWRELEAAIDRLKLRDRVVHLRGCARAQLLGVYGHALAFVHPSLAETCSFPLLEALALGLPIAAARMSALPEMAGDAALYFDPHSANELAAALDRLVWDEQLRDELSRKAIARAERFSWQATAHQTLRVFEQVVEG